MTQERLNFNHTPRGKGIQREFLGPPSVELKIPLFELEKPDEQRPTTEQSRDDERRKRMGEEGNYSASHGRTMAQKACRTSRFPGTPHVGGASLKVAGFSLVTPLPCSYPPHAVRPLLRFCNSRRCAPRGCGAITEPRSNSSCRSGRKWNRPWAAAFCGFPRCTRALLFRRQNPRHTIRKSSTVSLYCQPLPPRSCCS